MRTAGFLLILASLGATQEVRLELDRGLPATDLIAQIHAATDRPILYAPADLARKQVKGEYDMAVPRESMRDLLAFLLSTCGVEVRHLGPFSVVLPSSALVSEFRETGVETPLRFERSPTGWHRANDLAGSLSEKTVRALLREAAAGNPRAAQLLGYAAPRTPDTATALLDLLDAGDARTRAEAARALGRLGYAAKALLPALRERKGFPELVEAIATIDRARHPALLDPALAVERAPKSFRVLLDTTKGEILIEVHRGWAPRAADRFYNLVRIGFFDGARFFRVIDGFVAQFGKSGDPEINQAWYSATLRDEPVVESNQRGTLAFAKADDPNSRSTQVFINLADNRNLDAMGFSPFGAITKGMDVAERLYSRYRGSPDQNLIHFKGEEYLAESFPKLDRIKRARIVE